MFRREWYTALVLVVVVSQMWAQSPADSVRISFRTYQIETPTVYVPGEFNNWGPNSGGNISVGAPATMTYDPILGCWVKTYSFKIHDAGRGSLGDSVYQYKFNRGGGSSGWYGDPLNPEVNGADQNNSVLRLTRLFWFEYYQTESNNLITRLTLGLVHANNTSIISVTFGTSTTIGSPLTVVDVTSGYTEPNRVLDITPASPLAKSTYIRIVARTSNGDSLVFEKGGVAAPQMALPAYAKHGVTLPGSWSQDSTTFRLRVPGKDLVMLHVAPLGQDPGVAAPILMRHAPGTDDWWLNVQLGHGSTYEYLYEVENARRVYDPWGKWNGTKGSRFSTGSGGLTADDFSWTDGGFVRPPLNKLVIYELQIGEFTGGYYGLGPGQGNFGQLKNLLPYFDTLGVNAIELMPVTDFGDLGTSGFSWGYDVNSTFSLEPSYGTPADFKSLVDAAHARGIAVILDVVYNHLTDASALWQMLPDEVANPYFKVGTDLRPNEDGLLFFRDMDHWTDETQELTIAALKMWIDDYHIDGFRYDFTQGIGWDVNQPTKGVLGWTNRIAADYGNSIYQIAEHLPESPALIHYSGMTSGWHDSFHDRVFDEANTQAVPIGDIANLAIGLGAFPGNDTPSTPFPYGDRVEPVNMVNNHDELSILYDMSVVQSIPIDFALKRDRLYGSLMFLSLGVPMLWEGQEFSAPRGWTNGSQRLSYRPVEWNFYATPRGQEHFKYYQALIRLRKTHPALTRGGLRQLAQYTVGQKGLVWGYEDTLSVAKIMVVGNFISSPQTFANIPWLATGTWYNAIDGTPFTVSGATVDTLSVPGYTALIFRNTPDTVTASVGGQPTAQDLPTSFALGQNFPNPFNPTTAVSYQLSAISKTEIAVYDMLGRKAAELVNEVKAPGRYTVSWDASRLSSGTYVCRMTAGGFTASTKMILMK